MLIFFLSGTFSFAIAVLLNDRQFPAAFALSKRESRMKAAYQAFYQLSLDAKQSQVKSLLSFTPNRFVSVFNRDLLQAKILHYSIVLHQKLYQRIMIYVLVCK